MIRDKFRENADYFAIEQSWCIYIWLKTTDLVKAYLIPYYIFINSQFKLVNKILTYLKTYFLISIKKKKAQNRFNNIYI